MVLHYGDVYNLDIIRLRFSMVYGYGKTETVAPKLSALIHDPFLSRRLQRRERWIRSDDHESTVHSLIVQFLYVVLLGPKEKST